VAVNLSSRCDICIVMNVQGFECVHLASTDPRVNPVFPVSLSPVSESVVQGPRPG
jgi:hypothetical protein